tara:strand:- start:27431 stop:28771 length:1341 start_codon:yes stop_codon:yes gene_type:complete
MDSQAAVILAAGQGSRMKSRLPKALHRVCGKEMVSLVLDAVKSAGFEKVIVVTSSTSNELRSLLGSSVNFVEQSEQLGTGHALLQAKSSLDGVDQVLVIGTDTPLVKSESLSKLLACHKDTSALVSMLTSYVKDPSDFGRVIRDKDGLVKEIVEHQYDELESKPMTDVNAGVYIFDTSWALLKLQNLSPRPNGEIFLTDLISLAKSDGGIVSEINLSDATEVLGVNTRKQLSVVENVFRRKLCQFWMDEGVNIPDPSTVYLDSGVKLGRDTTLMPNTHVLGLSIIGEGCLIGPNTIVDRSNIGDHSNVLASMVTDSTFDQEVKIGPQSNIRPGCYLESKVEIGSFAEIKNSRIGKGSKIHHFSYIGDSIVGKEVNIGAGSVTCNYDGDQKSSTIIGDRAFIGSGSMLVAPVSIGIDSKTGAGSVVTSDVDDGQLVLGVPAKLRKKN